MDIKIKVNTALVIVKSVELTAARARQLDIFKPESDKELMEAEYVGRISGRVLFGADEDGIEYALLIHGGVHKLYSLRYAYGKFRTQINALPKLVL